MTAHQRLLQIIFSIAKQAFTSKLFTLKRLLY
ncbi:hypothetical protein T4C_13459 [Trichinella pseudospiralis]|uniref:Uncharacterized protein n=1 Tax=Trichinella pseudospiralis TaxID=6337 RepID=A0A0V1GG53_TRIPS|nr:hypothetical protein T4C_13459 [Trichinella pseudospiralis]